MPFDVLRPESEEAQEFYAAMAAKLRASRAKRQTL